MAVPRTTRLQFLVVHPGFWLSVLIICIKVSFGYRFMVVHQTTSCSIFGCPLMSTDFFGRPGRTDNQNFKRCLSHNIIEKSHTSLHLGLNSGNMVLKMSMGLSILYKTNSLSLPWSWLHSSITVHFITSANKSCILIVLLIMLLVLLNQPHIIILHRWKDSSGLFEIIEI